MLKLKNILGRLKNRSNKRLGGQLDCLKGKAEEKRTVFDDVQMEEPSPYLRLGEQEKRNQKEPSLMMLMMRKRRNRPLIWKRGMSLFFFA